MFGQLRPGAVILFVVAVFCVLCLAWRIAAVTAGGNAPFPWGYLVTLILASLVIGFALWMTALLYFKKAGHPAAIVFDRVVSPGGHGRIIIDVDAVSARCMASLNWTSLVLIAASLTIGGVMQRAEFLPLRAIWPVVETTASTLTGWLT